jgi:tRNA:m4X modification enzyme
MLSLALADTLKPTCDIVLVDRAAVRHKADRELSKAPHCTFARIKSDIADVSLQRVTELQGKRIVAVSKHLCGGATDLALRAVKIASTPGEGATAIDVHGIAIATCCHHRCTWDQYVSQAWFTEQVRLVLFIVIMALRQTLVTCCAVIRG